MATCAFNLLVTPHLGGCSKRLLAFLITLPLVFSPLKGSPGAAAAVKLKETVDPRDPLLVETPNLFAIHALAPNEKFGGVLELKLNAVVLAPAGGAAVKVKESVEPKDPLLVETPNLGAVLALPPNEKFSGVLGLKLNPAVVLAPTVGAVALAAAAAAATVLLALVTVLLEPLNVGLAKPMVAVLGALDTVDVSVDPNLKPMVVVEVVAAGGAATLDTLDTVDDSVLPNLKSMADVVAASGTLDTVDGSVEPNLNPTFEVVGGGGGGCGLDIVDDSLDPNLKAMAEVAAALVTVDVSLEPNLKPMVAMEDVLDVVDDSVHPNLNGGGLLSVKLNL